MTTPEKQAPIDTRNQVRKTYDFLTHPLNRSLRLALYTLVLTAAPIALLYGPLGNPDSPATDLASTKQRVTIMITDTATISDTVSAITATSITPTQLDGLSVQQVK